MNLATMRISLLSRLVDHLAPTSDDTDEARGLYTRVAAEYQQRIATAYNDLSTSTLAGCIRIDAKEAEPHETPSATIRTLTLLALITERHPEALATIPNDLGYERADILTILDALDAAGVTDSTT